MQQDRVGSLIEAFVNTVIGYVVALGSQLLIFPFFDIHVTFGANLRIGLWFTAVSLLRSYVIRRCFNARLHKAAQQLAKVAMRD